MPEPLEQLARQQIEAQLVAAGWVVQDYRQFNPAAGRGIALREAPLKSGTCDYLLLVDRKAVGVTEAKTRFPTTQACSQLCRLSQGFISKAGNWDFCGFGIHGNFRG